MLVGEGGGTPSSPGLGATPGTPHHHHPDLARGYPRYPPPSRPGWGTPPPSRPGRGTPHYPDLAEGYSPPSRPGWGTPHLQDLAGIPPTIQTWLRYPLPSTPGWGTPLPPIKVWTDKQTENSTFPHPLDAGGNNKALLRERKRHTACHVASTHYAGG